MKNAVLLITLTFFLACQNNNQNDPEIARLKAALENTQQELAQLKEAKDPPLVHIVYLNLKDDIEPDDKATVIAAIDRLKEIPVVQQLEQGNFANLNDPRAFSDYELVFQMNFSDEKAYASYQAHPIHLALKEAVKPLLAGPPATYDYWIGE